MAARRTGRGRLGRPQWPTGLAGPSDAATSGYDEAQRARDDLDDDAIARRKFFAVDLPCEPRAVGGGAKPQIDPRRARRLRGLDTDRVEPLFGDRLSFEIDDRLRRPVALAANRDDLEYAVVVAARSLAGRRIYRRTDGRVASDAR